MNKKVLVYNIHILSGLVVIINFEIRRKRKRPYLIFSSCSLKHCFLDHSHLSIYDIIFAAHCILFEQALDPIILLSLCRSWLHCRASTCDVHHQGQGQLCEAGVWETGWIETVGDESSGSDATYTRCRYVGCWTGLMGGGVKYCDQLFGRKFTEWWNI